MATGTNGIATEGEAKSKLGYSGSVDTNKCCTKARAVAMGADSAKLGNYSDSQLVKYSDIIKLNLITISGTFNLNLRSDIFQFTTQIETNYGTITFSYAPPYTSGTWKLQVSESHGDVIINTIRFINFRNTSYQNFNGTLMFSLKIDDLDIFNNKSLNISEGISDTNNINRNINEGSEFIINLL